MKKSKIFPQIIYYLFTFSLGLLLAFTLPYYFMAFELPLGDMEKYLAQGEPDKAMELVGGYFNREPVYSSAFDDGGGIVLFEAATLTADKPKEGEEATEDSKLQKTYAGFIFGVRDTYHVGGEADNKTKLIVTNLNGEEKSVELLDYDIDDNKIKENIGSLMTSGFVYLDVDQVTYGSLSKLTFIDNVGGVFKEIILNLDFSEKFFEDVNTFVEEYNRDFKSDKLAELDRELLSKNENYAISSHGDMQKRADTKAAVIIVAYFVGIYVIGDFLVGNRYIWRFFKWVYYKIRKDKPRKKSSEEAEVFGHDYYSQVKMELDVSELPDFSESVQIRYTNGDGEISFTLLKENGYADTQRIKAGAYVNAWIDINREYAPVDMPETLTVEGYKMSVKIKIIKRKEESV